MIGTATPCPLERTVEYPRQSGYCHLQIDVQTGMDALPPSGQRVIVKVSLSSDSKTASGNKDEDQEIDEFLETVYILSDGGEARQAIDVIFQRMNELLNDGSFRLCDKILAKVDVSRLTSTLMVGFLSITLAAKEFLCARASFHARVFASLRKSRGSQASAARLLDKYK